MCFPVRCDLVCAQNLENPACFSGTSGSPSKTFRLWRRQRSAYRNRCAPAPHFGSKSLLAATHLFAAGHGLCYVEREPHPPGLFRPRLRRLAQDPDVHHQRHFLFSSSPSLAPVSCQHLTVVAGVPLPSERQQAGLPELAHKGAIQDDEARSAARSVNANYKRKNGSDSGRLFSLSVASQGIQMPMSLFRSAVVTDLSRKVNRPSSCTSRTASSKPVIAAR